MKIISLATLLLVGALNLPAAIQSKTVTYRQGDTTLEGVLVWDDALSGPRPGVLVVHQWMGITDYEKQRAKQLAQLGYVAFCADIYGQGIRPTDTKAAGAEATKYKSNRTLFRQRVNAGLEQLKTSELVDGSRIAAIGYCFGGTAVLELARSGADVQGVVSFHGGLDSPTPADAKNIKGKVLAMHGADDPYVPAKEVAAFEDEMRAAQADWALIKFGGAVHSFTQPMAGNDNSKGAAYNEKADKRSWAVLKLFLGDVLK